MPDPVLFRLTTENGLSFSSSVLKDGITISRTANFRWQEVINRSSGVCTFASGNPLKIEVTLTLAAHDKDNWNAQDIAKFQKALLSFLLPRQDSLEPPTRCYITFGSGILLNNYLCVCEGVNCHPNTDGVWDENGDPITGVAALSFSGVELKNQSDTDWAGNTLRDYKNVSFP